MKINMLRLGNFKRYDNISIDISSPINLFLGPNSSGKSSIIKSIIGLKQTASLGNEHETFSAQGDYVDLGTYRDYVRNHDIKSQFSIGCLTDFDKSRPVYTELFEAGVIYIEVIFDYDYASEQSRIKSVTIKEDPDGDFVLLLERKKTRSSYTLKFSDTHAKLLLEKWMSKDDKSNIQEIIGKWTAGISLEHYEKYTFISSNKSRDKNFLDIEPLYIFNSLLSTFLRGIDRDCFYLGPLRKSPARSYTRTAHSLSVGANGEHTPSVFSNLVAKANKSRGQSSLYKEGYQNLLGWMNLIFPGRGVQPKSLDELVKLEVTRGGKNDLGREAISDVGFGFSQVFPILVQAAVMPKNATLIIEQPELHLHPMAQAALARVIADATKKGKRFIIETHSEHFVRGLQLAVSEHRLNNNLGLSRTDICFYYVPPSPADISTIQLNEWGEFESEWPAGFFDESYRLAMELLKNKSKRV